MHRYIYIRVRVRWVSIFDDVKVGPRIGWNIYTLWVILDSGQDCIYSWCGLDQGVTMLDVGQVACDDVGGVEPRFGYTSLLGCLQLALCGHQVVLDLGLATHIDYVVDVGPGFGYIDCACSWTWVVAH